MATVTRTDAAPERSFGEGSKASLRAFSRLVTGNPAHDERAVLPPVLETALAGAIFVTDAAQRIVYANRSAAALAWDPSEPVVGRTCREAFRCANCPPDCPLLRGAPHSSRQVVLRAGGTKDVTLLKKAEALLDDCGTLVGGIEVMHDLGATDAAASRTTDARRLLRLARSTSFQGMIGRSPRMSALLDRIDRLARVDVTVLVTGESGSGKELVARALHECGHRAGRPFVAINCAALPHDLLESELFGHERGAFTGAVRDKPGRFELCEGGTLLLDEIGCLPLPLQAKLLRVLEDGRFERVGGTRTLQLNARVVAATNADLDARVRDGSFRADLLYRLNVCPVVVPSLRERGDDIPLLAEYFAEQLAPGCGTRSCGFTAEAMEALRHYAWPGNVRELRNAVNSALLVAFNEPIGREHLPPNIAKAVGDAPGPLGRATIEEALLRARFNRAAAAGLLGVSRTTLWRHMKRAGLR
jgi:transcriptional regulator with GAF, ATPase, and Fis domain